MKSIKGIRFLEHAKHIGNPIVLVSIDGVEQSAFRQGGIRIWACPMRPKLSPQEAAMLDAECDRIMEEMRDLLRASK